MSTRSPLVLLHGIQASGAVWKPVLPALEAEHTVYTPTLLGHRGGPPLGDGVVPSLAAMADALEAELDAAELARPHVAGNSLGGLLAIELARRGRARSVTALSPAGAWLAPRDLARVSTLLALGRRGMLRNERRVRDLFRRPRARRLALSLVMEHGDRIPAGEVSGLLDDLVGCTVFDAFVAELRQSTAGYAHDGRTIDCPVQIAWAGNDRTIPFSRYGRPWADALPEAKLVTLPGVGHVPMYDDPGLVADTILDLTRRTDSRRTPTPMNTTPEIHVHRWNGTPPSWIGVIAHGYGEHAGRYQHVARRFVADGAVVYAPDHRGHGLSPGERALVSDIEAIVDDLAGVVDAAKAEHPGLPVVLLGHSMGGIVATRYAQRTGSSTIDALVLTGPAIGGNPEIEGLLALDPIPDVPIDPAILSRDEAVQRAYAEDDLVYHGPFARASLEGMFGAVATIADGPRIEVPTLWIHGELDGLAPLEPTRAAIERVRPEAFDHEVYPGAMHEVLNEINRDEVLDRITGFVQANT